MKTILKEVQAVLGKRLDKFGLKVAEDKTHVTHLGANNEGRRKLTFLGFSIFKAMTVNKTGQKIVFSTDAKRFTRAKATIKEKMWKQMHEEPKKQAKVINAILTGHYNYYGMAGNSKRLVSFYYEVERYWRRCLSRRSQNGKMSWDELNNLRSKYPLRQPFIKIPYGSLKQYVRL
jgi:hypothetical protein